VAHARQIIWSLSPGTSSFSGTLLAQTVHSARAGRSGAGAFARASSGGATLRCDEDVAAARTGWLADRGVPAVVERWLAPSFACQQGWQKYRPAVSFVRFCPLTSTPHEVQSFSGVPVAGMVTLFPHFRHLADFPAALSGAFATAPQEGHEIAIAMTAYLANMDYWGPAPCRSTRKSYQMRDRNAQTFSFFGRRLVQSL